MQNSKTARSATIGGGNGGGSPDWFIFSTEALLFELNDIMGLISLMDGILRTTPKQLGLKENNSSSCIFNILMYPIVLYIRMYTMQNRGPR